MGNFFSMCYNSGSNKPVKEREFVMRKPALKFGLLIAFVLFTTVSCNIFINTGETTQSRIQDSWQLVSIIGVPWTANYQVYTFNNGTITEFIGGLYIGQGSYAVNGDTVVLNNNFNSIDLLTGSYDVSFNHNYMYFRGFGVNSFYVFYGL
jgi:hypothetical protein